MVTALQDPGGGAAVSDRRMKRLLFAAIFIVAALPIAAAFYLVDDALQRSLNLGFNRQVLRSLEMGAKNLKTLKRIDPADEAEYRAQFDVPLKWRSSRRA